MAVNIIIRAQFVSGATIFGTYVSGSALNLHITNNTGRSIQFTEVGLHILNTPFFFMRKEVRLGQIALGTLRPNQNYQLDIDITRYAAQYRGKNFKAYLIDSNGRKYVSSKKAAIDIFR